MGVQSSAAGPLPTSLYPQCSQDQGPQGAAPSPQNWDGFTSSFSAYPIHTHPLLSLVIPSD